jgi:hypothetical protein
MRQGTGVTCEAVSDALSYSLSCGARPAGHASSVQSAFRDAHIHKIKAGCMRARGAVKRKRRQKETGAEY